MNTEDTVDTQHNNVFAVNSEHQHTNNNHTVLVNTADSIKNVHTT